MINLLKRFRVPKLTTRNFLISYFFLGLLGGHFLMKGASGAAGAQDVTIMVVLIVCFFSLFVVWLLNQVYDFDNRNFKKLSVGSRVIIVIFLIFMSIGGGRIGIVAVSILFLCLLLQIFFWIRFSHRKSSQQ